MNNGDADKRNGEREKTSHPCILAFSHNARIHIGFRCTHILIWLCPGMCVSATTVLFCLPSDLLNISIPWTLENDKFSVYYSGTKWMSILPSETTSNQQQCMLSRQDWLKPHMKTIIRSPEFQVYILDVFFLRWAKYYRNTDGQKHCTYRDKRVIFAILTSPFRIVCVIEIAGNREVTYLK